MQPLSISSTSYNKLELLLEGGFLGFKISDPALRLSVDKFKVLVLAFQLLELQLKMISRLLALFFHSDHLLVQLVVLANESLVLLA